ncbi:uncharacterized protein LOC130691326 isoform X2 [Daphnia carinata]|uniref:uncharacterized protein LOC130691326 isoform X2 n=1 Tax=Daphnia carinata TaxID=120202 RepID=UPI00257A49FD|nr:uncharacterized protein LOC130691326 isoform X2 [Daphnia carinata]
MGTCYQIWDDQKIKSNFPKINIPNSWLSALCLQEIKNEWSREGNNITPKVLNALRKSLTSTFKLYIKDLKHVMRTADFIRLELCCKAVFHVMRSANCTSAVKLQTKEAFFPCWNGVLWTKTKNSFGLKDDIFMEEIKCFYSELRLKLGHAHREKEILDTFGDMMKKYFPSLISFMRKIKLSRLEKIQKNITKLDKQFEFLRSRLNNGFLNELIILDVLEDVQRKKVTDKALKFWKENKQVEATMETSIEATLYALPPDPKFASNDNQFYPPCFLTNPFMPTHIVLENGGQLEAILINRTVPRKPNGEAFGPHWFADTIFSVIKSEKGNLSIDNESKKETSSVSEISIIGHSVERRMERSIKLSLYADDGSEKEEVLVPNSSDGEPTQRVGRHDEIGSLASYNLPNGPERVNSVQSWVNNSRPHSSSSIENENDELEDNLKISYRELTRCQSVVPTTHLSLQDEGQQEAVVIEKAKEWAGLDGDLTEFESDAITPHAEEQKSFVVCIHTSDTDFVSSTTASSCNRIQTRARYKHLTGLANWKKKERNDSQSYEGDSDAELNASPYSFPRRLRSQSRIVIPDSVTEKRNTRLKRKCRKLSTSTSSSDCLASAKRFQVESQTSDGVPTSYRTATSTDAKSEESWSGERRSRLGDRGDVTPPLGEASSNYHTPTRQVDSVVTGPESETTGMRTGIKRKLLDDAELAEDNPKSKRIPVDDMSSGKNILPIVVEKLKKHSEKLRMSGTCFTGHCEKLDMCIQSVSSSHQKLLRKNSTVHDATEGSVGRKTFSLMD